MMTTLIGDKERSLFLRQAILQQGIKGFLSHKSHVYVFDGDGSVASDIMSTLHGRFSAASPIWDQTITFRLGSTEYPAPMNPLALLSASNLTDLIIAYTQDGDLGVSRELLERSVDRTKASQGTPDDIVLEAVVSEFVVGKNLNINRLQYQIQRMFGGVLQYHTAQPNACLRVATSEESLLVIVDASRLFRDQTYVMLSLLMRFIAENEEQAYIYSTHYVPEMNDERMASQVVYAGFPHLTESDIHTITEMKDAHHYVFPIPVQDIERFRDAGWDMPYRLATEDTGTGFLYNGTGHKKISVMPHRFAPFAEWEKAEQETAHAMPYLASIQRYQAYQDQGNW